MGMCLGKIVEVRMDGGVDCCCIGREFVEMDWIARVPRKEIECVRIGVV